MGRYINASHVEQLLGTDNVACWSNLDNDQAAGSIERVQRAIAWAEDYLDDRFRGSRYQVPLEGTQGPLLQVQDWAAWLAGWRLRQARGIDQDRSQQQLDSVNRQIELVLRGRIHLPAVTVSHMAGPRVAR